MGSNYDLQVQRAKEAFLRWDSRLIAEKFSLRRDSQWIYLPYLERMHRINCETGDVEPASGGRAALAPIWPSLMPCAGRQWGR